MTTQHPTQQGWPPQPPPNQPPYPPHRTGGWKRGLIITALALVGTFLGMMTLSVTGAALAPESPGISIVGMLVGLWLGLAGGIWFGVWVTRRR
jgi:hypothetical protein